MTLVELRTEHDKPEKVARAVVPDNTEDMETHVENGRVVTRVERENVESAGATGDDYLRNLVVADDLLEEL